MALPELTEAVSADAQHIHNSLSDQFHFAGLWVVSSQDTLATAAEALRRLDVDLVILVFQVWAENVYLVPLLQAIGDRALAVWCYTPWERPPRPTSFLDVLRGSGPVGTLEGLGVLRNLQVDFAFTFGAPGLPRFKHDLLCAARAGQVRRALRKARFAVLPYRNEQMQTTFVDEFRLRTELGPSVSYLSVRILTETMQELDEGDISQYVASSHEQFPIRGVSEATLRTAARAALGVAQPAVEHEIDVLSLNDIAPELHDALGLRPCLYPPQMEQEGILLGIEGDLRAAVAMFVLNQLTRSPLMFAETWFWDEFTNEIVTGHAGPQNPDLAVPGSAWISHDFEFAQSDRTEGAHLQFAARPGPVTMFQVRGTPSGWQAIVTTGEIFDAEPWIEGYPHATMRLDAPISEFLKVAATVGTTQHWALAYDNVSDEVRACCQLLSVPLQTI